MIRGYAFPGPVRRFGLLGLSGIAVFISSIISLHMMGGDIDWIKGYVSNLANGPLGWIFVAGTFVHGLGNLALNIGLARALRHGRLRNWATAFFGLAATGILLASLFPTDPPGQAASVTGLVHRSAASGSFALELAALFIFSSAFRHQRGWRRRHAVSLILAVAAALALTAFAIAIQTDVAPGLAERVSLAIFLVWEIWAGLQLNRRG